MNCHAELRRRRPSRTMRCPHRLSREWVMRTVSTLLATFVGVAVLLAAPVPKEKKAKTVEEKVVGRWKMTGSDNGVSSNFYIVFGKGGELEFRYDYDTGRPSTVYPGKFKTTEPDDENKLGTIDWTVKQGAGERGEVSRILELTDDILEFVDPKGVKEKFERVREEKKDK